MIQRVVDETNGVIAQANTALGQRSFGRAWPHAAEMVRLSRLDAWPLATQAIRDAGLVGTVRVRVTNQAGSPIPGAFVTVLTAHTPVGVRADGSGWATVVNVAAVPTLQVKAYAGGLVYHEVHANLAEDQIFAFFFSRQDGAIVGHYDAVTASSRSQGQPQGVAPTLRIPLGDHGGSLLRCAYPWAITAGRPYVF